MMTGNNSALRFNKNWAGDGTDVMTLNANGNISMPYNLNVGSLNSGYGVLNSYLLSYDTVYARSSYDTKIRSDSGGMYLECGDIGNNNYLRLGVFNGNTEISSGASRPIVMRTTGYGWLYTGASSYNPTNSSYWNTVSDH
jgi:hypothetical protein